MKLTLTPIFIFSIVFLLCVIIMTIQIILKPDTIGITNTNLDNEPNIKPKFVSVQSSDVEYAKKKNINCISSYKSCTGDIDCAGCPGGDYECQTITTDKNIEINGDDIGKNSELLNKKICLPATKDVKCNLNTSKFVWSQNEIGNNVEEKWKCECLYPNLFGGENCDELLECKKGDDHYGQLIKQNTKISGPLVWDPTAVGFSPDNTTPYDSYTLKPGGTKYATYGCECNNKNTADNMYYVNLPNDPYRCHPDPCSSNHSELIWDEKNNKCNVGGGTCAPLIANTDTNSVLFVQRPSDIPGKYQCLRTPISCKSWNTASGECTCAEDSQMYVNNCDSVDYPRQNAVKCPYNQVGSDCFNLSDNDYCLNGGTPFINNTSENEFKVSCICPQPAVNDKPIVKNTILAIYGDQCEFAYPIKKM